jgi:hypothetical protein
MDDGFAAIAVTVFLLDHSRPVTRFVLLDHGLLLTIANDRMAFANRHARANGADANADIVSQSGSGKRTGRSSGQQQFPHVILLMIEWRFNVTGTTPFRIRAHKNCASRWNTARSFAGSIATLESCFCLNMISAQTRSAFAARKTVTHFSGSCFSV